jgi:hypothetical protein
MVPEPTACLNPTSSSWKALSTRSD